MKTGKFNPRWNGGTSEYKNHIIMKKNRILKFVQENYLCEICKNTAEIIHHKDGTKENHNLENLMVLCRKCHGEIHSRRKNKNSKFIKIYGMSASEMKIKLGIKSANVYRFHQKGILKSCLENIK